MTDDSEDKEGSEDSDDSFDTFLDLSYLWKVIFVFAKK